MTTIQNILVASVLSASLFGTAHAAEQTMKPLQGVSLHSGSKHAVAYFLSESNSCNLVVTSIDDADSHPTRQQAALEAGYAARYQLTEGKSFEFACDGPTMTVRPLQGMATN